MRLKGQVILVTGAGKGIGKALVIGFAKEGARVSFCSRSKEELARVADAILSFSEEIFFDTCDVTMRDQVQGFVQRTAHSLGPVSVLVNNAGVLGVRAPLVDYPIDRWDEVLRVNLTGALLVTQEVLRVSMIPQKRGVIVHVSSGVGRRGKPNWGAYAVSKFGVEGLSQVLAEELKSLNIYSLAANPGPTRTQMRAEAYPQEDSNTLKSPEKLVEFFVGLIQRAPSLTGKSVDYDTWPSTFTR